MSEPEPGEVRVWNGRSWTRLMSGSARSMTSDGTTITLSFGPESLDPPDSLGPRLPRVETVEDPDGADDGAVVDLVASELLEVLLCGECGMELSAPACGALHAYLVDNPLEHRLLKPLVLDRLEQMRKAGLVS